MLGIEKFAIEDHKNILANIFQHQNLLVNVYEHNCIGWDEVHGLVLSNSGMLLTNS